MRTPGGTGSGAASVLDGSGKGALTSAERQAVADEIDDRLEVELRRHALLDAVCLVRLVLGDESDGGPSSQTIPRPDFTVSNPVTQPSIPRPSLKRWSPPRILPAPAPSST